MARVYRQRHPEKSVLYRVLFHHFEEFLSEYENRFQKSFGYFRPVIQKVVGKYLDCGNPFCGFARIRCQKCGKEYLLSFSCKVRGFCPSCHAKRLEEWGEWMREKLILDVPHCQVVFVIPKMLRIFFKYHRKLQGTLCQCAVKAFQKYLQGVTRKNLIPGIIGVIQTFGQRINFHPHIHLLVTEGGIDEEGIFHKVSCFDDPLIARFFCREVFSLLLNRKLISVEWVQKILSWRHTGFHVHSQVRGETKKQIERIGKYMIRPLLSLERLSLDEKEGQVIYQYGKQQLQEERMDYLEFIARVTSHIPEKNQVMIRYFGVYANAHRGKIRKTAVESHELKVIEEDLPRISRKGWAEMIKKVYEVNPLICPECHGEMQIISFLTDWVVVDRIIKHLQLNFMAERPPPPQGIQQNIELEVTPADIF